MLWNTDPDTHKSVRSPAFFGPVVLSAALLTVSCFSTPIWNQFGLLEVKALNTTLLVGGYGACIKIKNDTGIIGPTRYCSESKLGFELNINMAGDSFTNWPFPEGDNGIILGTTPQADTTQVIPIYTSGQTSQQSLHIITAIIALLAVLSLIVPPRWIKGGKGGLANFQRSGILTLILTGIAFILSIVTFACIFNLVLDGKKKLNAISGIEANWPGSASFWFILPSCILYIPPFLVTLLPVYVRERDDYDTNYDETPLVNKDSRR